MAGFLPYYEFVGPPSSPAPIQRLALGGVQGTPVSIRALGIFQWLWPVALVCFATIRSMLGKSTSREVTIGALLIASALVVTSVLILVSQSDRHWISIEIGFWLAALASCLMVAGTFIQTLRPSRR